MAVSKLSHTIYYVIVSHNYDKGVDFFSFVNAVRFYVSPFSQMWWGKKLL